MSAGYVFHSLSVCAGCGCDGDDFGSVNVEAFEATGELYCDDCADEAIAKAGGFYCDECDADQPGQHRCEVCGFSRADERPDEATQ